MSRRVVVLGSTGSIGTQALEVIEALRPEVEVAGLVAGSRVDSLAEQAGRFRPPAVAVADDRAAKGLRERLAGLNIEVLSGPQGVVELCRRPGADLVLAAIVGLAGLPAAMAALESGKDLALANKEVLVAGGALVTDLARRTGRRILPVDSEHSAIFQCLLGEDPSSVRRLILTASGGPFRGRTAGDLEAVTVREALRHPRWTMGPKITIDSATLMNKGLEIIEAQWLFGVPVERIDVVIHPQSIVHSLVEFVDGSVKAQLGSPDMHLPIQLALTHPRRVPVSFAHLDLLQARTLQFEPPDAEAFPCLRQAVAAAKIGGTAPAVLNAANEVAVGEFLAGRAGFMDIPRTVETVLGRHSPAAPRAVADVLQADAWAREEARGILETTRR